MNDRWQNLILSALETLIFTWIGVLSLIIIYALVRLALA